MTSQSSSFPDLSTVYDESANIDEEIRKFETFLEDAPMRRQEEKEKHLTTMPPPDDLEERERTKKFLKELKSKQEVTNQTRRNNTNRFLLVLLTFAILAMVMWIFQSLKSYGIFN